MLTLVSLALTLVGGPAAPARPAPPSFADSTTRRLDSTVTALADTLVEALFGRFPQWETYFARPLAHHDRLPDNSRSALRAWERHEDRWLAQLRAIDPARLAGREAWVTYSMMREGVEQSVATRVCRSELWSVDQFGGWQTTFASIADAQPVGTEALRREALARWRSLPRWVDIEIANLRAGLHAGYSAPRANVRLVIAQIDTMRALPIQASPFFAPAAHDSSGEFRREFESLVRDGIDPALERYRDFLVLEYLPRARTDAGLRALPDGVACYRASLRSASTLDVSPDDVYALGLREMASIEGEMRAVAARAVGDAALESLLRRLPTDTQYTFRTREQVLEFTRAAVARAADAAPRWFARVPRAGVSVEPYPAFRQATSVAEYEGPAEDGSRPGTVLVSTYQPERRSRIGLQAIAFHEGIPGHHLATGLAMEQSASAHPITRYLNNSGFVEGWALYAERLADEMGLYATDLDRLGMLTEQAWRAARLVVDPAIHLRGWSRARAIAYFMAHTAGSPDEIAAEVDRMTVTPGQGPAYMLGKLQIDGMRRDAERRLGSRFDVRAFHDALLADGSLPLSALRAKMERWAREAAGPIAAH